MASVEKLEDEEVGRHERFIVLLRHGIAEDKTAAKPDDDRTLTPEGHARMKQISRGLERIFPKAQAIYSSPLIRAVQTALWVSKGYRSRIQVSRTEAVLPSATPEEFLRFINSIRESRAIVVGHEPMLTENFMRMIGLQGERVALKKGGCYGIRLRTDGTAVVEWLLSPRVLRKLSELET